MTDYDKFSTQVNKFLPGHVWTPEEDEELRQSCEKLGMDFLIELI